MIFKYLEGSVTVKGIPLTNAVVRCVDVFGDEYNGTWSYNFGIYGDLNASIERQFYWFDNIKLIVMMDSYQPNNIEQKVNIFEYGLLKLKELDERFANFVLKEQVHNLNFTSPPSTDGSFLIDKKLYELNPLKPQPAE